VEHIWLAAVPEWVGRRAESLDHLRQAAERREPLFMLAGRHGFYLFVPPWASLPEYQAVLRIIGE
jgi:phage protein U